MYTVIRGYNNYYYYDYYQHNVVPTVDVYSAAHNIMTNFKRLRPSDSDGVLHYTHNRSKTRDIANENLRGSMNNKYNILNDYCCTDGDRVTIVCDSARVRTS